MAIQIEVAEDLQHLFITAVEVIDVTVAAATPALHSFAQQVAVDAAGRSSSADYESECQAVRQMLRYGKFKASGRSKPAQEYLMRCATNDGKLPCINGPVDLLNAVSLQANLPISLLSVAKCSNQLAVRRAAAGESFVFNTAGQVLELEDLITVYDVAKSPAKPIGTPIKDSMAGKIEASDSHLVAIIYSPKQPDAIARARTAAEQLAEGMKSFCQAREACIIA